MELKKLNLELLDFIEKSPNSFYAVKKYGGNAG